MSIQLPEVTVVGTLTADPELRFTTSGLAVANFTIASNSRRYDKNTQEWKEGDATFLRCNIWREYAENIAESLARGTRVIARGVLKQRSFETREGEKRTVFELEVEEIGPALRWATAKVNKVTRSGGGNASSSQSAASSAGDFQDPWGSTGSFSGSDDEPPF